MAKREAVMTREKPIIFSGPMVRAILDGRKTQTRRVVKPQPRCDWHPGPVGMYAPTCLDRNGMEYPGPEVFGAADEDFGVKAPYRVGDVLYVRETFATGRKDHFWGGVVYKATPPGLLPECEGYTKWKPSIHMSRELSRIRLRVTGVRVELVQSISEADAIAEGLFEWTDPPRIATKHYGIGLPDVWETDPRKAFKRLWCSIHGPGAWERNDWVWANTFERIGDDA